MNPDDKQGSERAVASSDLDRQLEMYRHNEDQAQKFLRTLLTGIAVFGVSLGTAVLTSWREVQRLLPQSHDEVVKTYDVNSDFVGATNDLNFLFGLFAISVAFLMTLSSAIYMIRVLQTRPIRASDRDDGEDKSGRIDDHLLKQHHFLFEGYFLAKWSGFLVFVGMVLVAAALIGRADILASLGIIVTLVTVSLFLYYIPKLLFQIKEWIGAKIESFKTEGIESLKETEGVQDFSPAPFDVLSITLFIGLLGSYLLYGGLVGYIWWAVAFHSQFESIEIHLFLLLYVTFLVIIFSHSLRREVSNTEFEMDLKSKLWSIWEDLFGNSSK